ncbi:hypothetical protein I3760_03G221200 [Carya illinoinensis]|nr:hypothetical protein I3760_03G221200 [Carya illinoinensis]
MVIFVLYLSTILNLFSSLPITTSETLPPYTPTDYFLLNCGSSSNSTSLDGRRWEGDSISKFSPRNIHSVSSSSEASEQDPSLSQVPHMTARIFDQQSKFTYSFPVSCGPKFLRLYFYPTSYSNRDITKSFFSVIANNFTLLSNFNAYLSISASNPSKTYLVKEFIIDVQNNQSLDITFIPSPSSYAFINGLEVVSMPNNLYISRNQYISTVTLIDNPNMPFYFQMNPFALETLYRLNVGGVLVSNVDDTGMFRVWDQDEDYIYGAALGTMPHQLNVSIKYTIDTPPYTAPEVVYSTSRTMGEDANVNLQYNLTWIFPVDAGFFYLVRLHFCETEIEFTHVNQRVFSIFIYNQTAENQEDVIAQSGGSEIPVHKDYVVLVPKKTQAKQDLWLALHPYRSRGKFSGPQYEDAILNGVEIFKLNQSDGNLASMVGPTSSAPEKKMRLLMRHKNRLSPFMMTIGFLIGALLAILSYMSIGKNVSTLQLNLCRYFSIMDIKVATQNFDHQLVIGAGRFGNVYKGYIDGGSTVVAIKRLNPLSKQGTRGFWTKIHMLSKLHHANLVALIGYCNDQDEMILVYEYVARGTLYSHLYETENPVLTWKQCIHICISTAHGLNYLHTGVKDTIIHHNVNPTNILLDKRLLAKVSNLCLSKLDPTSMSQSHFNTLVKGGFEYMDLEYYHRQKLTEKSDVWPALMPDLPKEQVNLTQWAKNYHSGTLAEIINPCLRGEIASECLHKFGEIADCCIRDREIDRPAMKDVVWALQLAHQVQENAEKDMDNVNRVEVGTRWD